MIDGEESLTSPLGEHVGHDHSCGMDAVMEDLYYYDTYNWNGNVWVYMFRANVGSSSYVGD